ncbi:MAG: hypothetical protein HXY50_02725 [Ignavibacteriaceae bacterium]|nr:hypothetical protein [Ignavibacteriaceae bacterium]
MIKICDVNIEAKEKLPQFFVDKSGIGVHFVDAFIKPMNVKFDDGTQVSCKRKGLKITLTAGTKKGEGLLRRIAVSTDPKIMLIAALQEAAENAEIKLEITASEIFMEF